MKDVFIENYEFPKALTESEIIELFNQLSNGDQTAKEKIIECNLRLVMFRIITKFNSDEYSKDELLSIGIIGLVKAVNTYDVTKGVKFSSYATTCIDNEILMFIRKKNRSPQEESLDKVINVNKKNGSEQKLSDILSDGTDVEQEYIDNEISGVIRNLVNELPDREKMFVTMYFGFDNGRKYKQDEIAKMFKVTRSYISKIIDRAVKKIGFQLEKMGFIEQITPKKKVARKGEDVKSMPRRLKTIYEYFSQYSREQIDQMILQLSEDERQLMQLRYGDDLDNPVNNEKWSEQSSIKYYGTLVPKMKRILSNLTSKKKSKSKRTNDQHSEAIPTVIPAEKQIARDVATSSEKGTSQPISELLSTLKLPTELVLSSSSDSKAISEKVTSDDYIKLLEILRNTFFMKMLKNFSLKESVIAILKLGYLDGKYFSTTSIAEFLGIESQDVIDVTKKVLFVYKEEMNRMLENAIQNVPEQYILSKQ